MEHFPDCSLVYLFDKEILRMRLRSARKVLQAELYLINNPTHLLVKIA